MTETDITYQKKELPSKFLKLGIILLAIGILLGIASFFADHQRAVYNYVVSYTFLISIGVGALFLVALEYVAGAVWSVPIRRIVEFLLRSFRFLQF